MHILLFILFLPLYIIWLIGRIVMGLIGTVIIAVTATVLVMTGKVKS